MNKVSEVGIDEVGRGAIFGPVFSSVVVLNEKNKSILIIGHNPTLFYLVEELANERIQKFTTCNLAVLNFGDEWKKLSKSKCKLKSLYRPKETEI